MRDKPKRLLYVRSDGSIISNLDTSSDLKRSLHGLRVRDEFVSKS